MFKVIFEYGWIVVAIIVVTVYFYNVYQRHGKEVMLKELRTKAYQFMVLAEKEWGQDQGVFKFADVVDRLHGKLPETAKKVITKELLVKYVQIWYNEMKGLLVSGDLLLPLRSQGFFLF